MAVAFDVTGVSVLTQAGTSPLAWTHILGATADMLLAAVVLDAGSACTPANNPITAMTFNAVTMGSSLLNWQTGGSTQTSGYMALYKLAAPATGSHSVSSAFTTTGLDGCIGGSASFITGAGSIGTPVHADSNSAGVTSGSIAVTGTNANSLICVFVTNGSGGTAFTTGTSRLTAVHSGTAAGGAWSVNCATIPGNGGTVTVNWTQTNDFYAAIAVEVFQGGAAPITGGKSRLVNQAVKRASLW